MKTLVTGGAGFIGSHLVEALCRNGADVRILDNLTLGLKSNLSWKQPSDRVELRQGDLRDEAAVRSAVEGVDTVFHLAAVNSVPRSLEHPEWTQAVNVDGTLRLLMAARDAGVRRFLYASSSSIYGPADPAPRRETDPPDPVSFYALQKFAAERYTLLFHRLHGMETVALRYFNVFGPRQRVDSPYAAVIPRFCAAALGGERPVVFGDGTQRRDFTHVENVVRANLLAAAAPAERVAGRVFNVACGTSVSLRELLDELGRAVGRTLEPEFRESRAGDIAFTRADISAAAAAFGYAPGVDWRTGLLRTLEDHRTRRGMPVGLRTMG